MSEVTWNPESIHQLSTGMMKALVDLLNDVERPLTHVALPEMPPGVRGQVASGLQGVGAMISGSRVALAELANDLKMRTGTVEDADQVQAGSGHSPGFVGSLETFDDHFLHSTYNTMMGVGMMGRAALELSPAAPGMLAMNHVLGIDAAAPQVAAGFYHAGVHWKQTLKDMVAYDEFKHHHWAAGAGDVLPNILLTLASGAAEAGAVGKLGATATVGDAEAAGTATAGRLGALRNLKGAGVRGAEFGDDYMFGGAIQTARAALSVRSALLRIKEFEARMLKKGVAESDIRRSVAKANAETRAATRELTNAERNASGSASFLRGIETRPWYSPWRFLHGDARRALEEADAELRQAQVALEQARFREQIAAQRATLGQEFANRKAHLLYLYFSFLGGHPAVGVIGEGTGAHHGH